MTIEKFRLLFPDATEKTWHQHPNGGGWVQNTAKVDGSAYVGIDCLVYGDAQVYGNAQIYGDARVYGGALVYGDALVYGNAQIYGNARVSGNARVFGNAWVSGNAWVYGDALVSGNARVSGNAWVSGGAWEWSPLQIQGTRHFVNVAANGILKIGCMAHPIAWWKEHYKAVGRAEGYTPEQVKEYRNYIELARVWMKIDGREAKAEAANAK